MKLLHVAALGLAVATLAALPAAAAAPEQRSITVAASGEANALAEPAEWTIGIRAEEVSARKAMRTSATTIARVRSALLAAGLSAGDLTVGLPSLFPNFQDRPGQVSAYVAVRTIKLTVRDPQRAAVLIDKASAVGANYVLGPSFSDAKSDELYDRALADALDAARAKARALAAKEGAVLGAVLSIDESRSSQYGYGYGGPYYVNQRLPFNPEEGEVYATVTVTFAIA
jgi:uncharacterized protein